MRGTQSGLRQFHLRTGTILQPQKMIECLIMSISLISCLILKQELDLQGHVELQQYRLSSQRNKRDMTWIPMSLEFMRNLHFLRAFCSSCLANFRHFSSSSNSPSFRSLSSIFSSSISLINNSSFWMASSASSLLLAFFLHFLHHIIYNSPFLVSVFRSHTNIFMHHYFYFMTP